MAKNSYQSRGNQKHSYWHRRRRLTVGLEKGKEWKLKTGEKWEGDKNTNAKMEENMKEMIIPTFIGWFYTICFLQ